MSNAIATCAYYCYKPSVAAATMFIAMFGQSGILHTYQLVRAKSLWMTPVAVACLLETIGYVCRLVGFFEAPHFGRPAFAVQSVVLLIAPTLFCATIYNWLTSLMIATQNQHLSSVRISRLNKIFIFSDCFSFLMQLVGAAMRLINKTSTARLGNRLVMTGIGEQLLFQIFFCFVAGKWHWKLSRHQTSQKGEQRSIMKRVWNRHLIALYVFSVLIAARNGVRLLESLLGPNGLVKKHEIFLYVFDAALMLALVAIMHFVHFSEVDTLYCVRDAQTGSLERGSYERHTSYFRGWKVWQLKAMAVQYVSAINMGLEGKA